MRRHSWWQILKTLTAFCLAAAAAGPPAWAESSGSPPSRPSRVPT